MKKLLTIIFIFTFTVNAYAATQLKKTVKPSGGDYTSLEACMNANEQNLTAADKYFDVEIDGDWSGGADTSAVTVHNYTTDATRYINIYTTATARHNGKTNGTNCYELNTGTLGSYGSCLSVNTSYVYLSGIKIKVPDSGVERYGISFGYAKNYGKLRYSLIYQGGSYYGGCHMVYVRGTNTQIYNNVITGAGDKGVYVHAEAYGTLEFYNNTVYITANRSDTHAFCNDGGAAKLKNNVFIITGENAHVFYNANFTQSGYTNNATSNAEADDDADNTNYINNVVAADAFISAGTDFTLKTGSVLIDAGVSVSGVFTDDITGTARGATWDIGAFEYVATGGAYSGLVSVIED